MAMAFWTLVGALVALSIGLGWLDRDRLRARATGRCARRRVVAGLRTDAEQGAPARDTTPGLPDPAA